MPISIRVYLSERKSRSRWSSSLQGSCRNVRVISVTVAPSTTPASKIARCACEAGIRLPFRKTSGSGMCRTLLFLQLFLERPVAVFVQNGDHAAVAVAAGHSGQRAQCRVDRLDCFLKLGQLHLAISPGFGYSRSADGLDAVHVFCAEFKPARKVQAEAAVSVSRSRVDSIHFIRRCGIEIAHFGPPLGNRFVIGVMLHHHARHGKAEADVEAVPEWWAKVRDL